MTHTRNKTDVGLNPVGESVNEAIAEATLDDPTYRQERERLAPFHAIAATVIAGRSALGMTQEALAEAVGSSSTAISRLESGRHPSTVRTLQRLSDALGVTFSIQPHGEVLAPYEEAVLQRAREWDSEVLTSGRVREEPQSQVAGHRDR